MRRTIPIAIELLSALTLGQTIRTSEPSKPAADVRRFLGAWRVLSVTDTRPDGTVVPDFYLGPHPIGFIVYEATGHMCFGAMNPDRAKWADESNGTPPRWRSLRKAMIATAELTK
jgi:Lipocalin-like domain